MKNWAGNAIGFAKDFANNLSNFFLGNPLDKGGNIKPLDPRHKGPGFHGLPEHQQEKEYELLRKLGPQASKKDLYDNYVMQGNPFLLDLAGTGKRMNEVGLNPWVSSVGLPGEPGRPGVPSAPKDGRPLLPGEKPFPKIFAAQPFLDNFLTAQNQGPSSPIKYYPDANSGSGGFLFNSGAGRLGNVRMKA